MITDRCSMLPERSIKPSFDKNGPREVGQHCVFSRVLYLAYIANLQSKCSSLPPPAVFPQRPRSAPAAPPEPPSTHHELTWDAHTRQQEPAQEKRP